MITTNNPLGLYIGLLKHKIFQKLYSEIGVGP